jgi:hypothetical protein
MKITIWEDINGVKSDQEWCIMDGKLDGQSTPKHITYIMGNAEWLSMPGPCFVDVHMPMSIGHEFETFHIKTPTISMGKQPWVPGITLMNTGSIDLKTPEWYALHPRIKDTKTTTAGNTIIFIMKKIEPDQIAYGSKTGRRYIYRLQKVTIRIKDDIKKQEPYTAIALANVLDDGRDIDEVVRMFTQLKGTSESQSEFHKFGFALADDDPMVVYTAVMDAIDIIYIRHALINNKSE